MDSNALRNLPKIDVLTDLVKGRAEARFSDYIITESCRRVIDELRTAFLSGDIESLPDINTIMDMVVKDLDDSSVFSLRPVINATGVVLHTNLGRAILSEAAAENVKKIASSYSTLEYNLETGERGSRHSHVESLICKLTGAESAMVVNNNAAAIMLALTANCRGREVVVSRGELVEIGGSFRVPEIMQMSGTILKEVGTTNKTKLSDYKNAISEGTAALLKVHTSNFKVVGFTESVDISALCSLARRNNLPLIYDLGSGLMARGNQLDAIGEVNVIDAIENGADIVCFSGDKLFGGAQAGIIIGQREYISAMKSHQLARVVRADKLTLAALEATLREYSDPRQAATSIPTLAALSISLNDLHIRATKLKRKLNLTNSHLTVVIKKSDSQVGGGSAPCESLESYVLEITSSKKTAQAIERQLRKYQTPIITRINKGSVLLDVRTIKESEFGIIATALKKIGERVANE